MRLGQRIGMRAIHLRRSSVARPWSRALLFVLSCTPACVNGKLRAIFIMLTSSPGSLSCRFASGGEVGARYVTPGPNLRIHPAAHFGHHETPPGLPCFTGPADSSLALGVSKVRTVLRIRFHDLHLIWLAYSSTSRSMASLCGLAQEQLPSYCVVINAGSAACCQFQFQEQPNHRMPSKSWDPCLTYRTGGYPIGQGNLNTWPPTARHTSWFV